LREGLRLATHHQLQKNRREVPQGGDLNRKLPLMNENYLMTINSIFRPRSAFLRLRLKATPAQAPLCHHRRNAPADRCGHSACPESK
jgi:hypothetical protein